MIGTELLAAFTLLNSGLLENVCYDVQYFVQTNKLAGQDVVNFAMDHLSKGHPISMNTRNHLKKSLQTVLNKEECSPSSLDYAATIGECNWIPALSPLTSPAKEYAIKCLRPEHIKDVLLTETQGKFDLGRVFGGKKLWEVINDQFLEDYEAANPSIKTDVLPVIGVSSYQLVAPLAKLLKRFAKERGQDFKTEAAVRSHIEEYVVAPCKSYAEAAERVMHQIHEAGRLVPGGHIELYRSLDRDAQMVIFRQKVCEAIPYDLKERKLAESVLNQLESDK